MYKTSKDVQAPTHEMSYIPKSNSNKIILYWSKIDTLYYYIIPNFMTTNFYSRKFIDFKLWCLAVKIYKFGYH
jgi:hypothetical protein